MKICPSCFPSFFLWWTSLANNSFSSMQNFYFLESCLSSSLSPIRTMDRFQETWYSLLIFPFYISVDQWWMDVHLRFIASWTSLQLPKRLPNNECYISKPWLLIYFQWIFGVHDIACKAPYLGWFFFFFHSFQLFFLSRSMMLTFLIARWDKSRCRHPQHIWYVRTQRLVSSRKHPVLRL